MNAQQQVIPQGRYVPATRGDNLIFTAGMTPRKNGVLLMSGKIRSSDELAVYRDIARQAAGNAVNAARNILNDGEKLSQVLSLSVFVNAETGYTQHSKLADFISDFLYEELGDVGIGSRTAVGVASLPGDAPLEVQMVFLVGLVTGKQ